jgi:hypothetical protein
MPEHVHLLLNELQQDTRADALKSLKQGLYDRPEDGQWSIFGY